MKYKIYDLSVRAMLNYSKPDGDSYKTEIDKNALPSCLKHSAHEQDDNALFYQIMCVLHGDDFKYNDTDLVTDLSDIIFYADFSRVFDRDSAIPYYAQLQKKAESLFMPQGASIDLNSGMHRYVAFERSASMSRNAVLSFIREDFYDKITERIRLDMDISMCQLSKLYAYNGLMLSGGTRIDNIDIDRPHRVIVVDNPHFTIYNTKVITVEDDGSGNSVRKYHRVERKENIDILGYDGEGVISKEYAALINKQLDGKHTSFQIRLPYIKGMLHQVDIHDFFKSAGVTILTDIWGVEYKVTDVDIILTKSMLKGYDWLTENNMTWEDYWRVFRKYRHALYISGVSKETPQQFTELNYQFLNTLSMTADEFRPLDLPLSFPVNDNRHWLTKETEREYYRLCCDKDYRLNFFTGKKHSRKSKDYYLQRILGKNPKFIAESVYADRLKSRAKSVLKQYALGRLIVSGDNRYLSADLLNFLIALIPEGVKITNKNRFFVSNAWSQRFSESAFYAPKAAYSHTDECTLLRNPHISRNEEIQLKVYPKPENMRKYYLGHLSDVVMVDWDSLTAERLGGADFDGDMIKTISDPIVNRCVKRNYEFDSLRNMDNIPLLKIPTAQPIVRDANDWKARFETVKSTFSSRVGQISNAALNRSIIAYNENSTAEQRDKCREETETLAILTGLEIDSAKSGVKPDLSKYLGTKAVAKSRFLKYKCLLEKSEGRRAWYEPTFEEQFEKFFSDTNWDKVDSNVERLPYLAYMLGKNTKPIVDKPAADSELFTFADDENWKSKLNSSKLDRLTALINDYEHCLSRIRACSQPINNKQRRNDILRILYSRGQDSEYDADMLYTLFQGISPERITFIRQELQARNWHLTPKEQRDELLSEWLPELEQYYELFHDFRFGGYRILIDLIADIDNENNLTDRKRLIRDGDSAEFRHLMEAYLQKPIPIPPVEEQHRIVTKIDELLPYIEKYEQAETQLSTLNANFPEALKKSILQEAVQGKLVSQNPDDEPASVLLERIRAEKQALIKAGKIKKDKHESVIVTRDKIPYEIIDGNERCIADEVPFQIPESWCWCRLSDIVSFIGGYAYNSSDFIPQSNSQVLRLGNVKNDEIKLSAKPVFISDSIAEETALFRCLINDILITMTGTRKKRDYFFTVRIFSEEPPLYINQRVGCLRAFDSSMAHWLTWILKSETILSQVFQYETGTANQGNLGAENILKTMIPLPPLVEQHRIVSKIEGFIQHYEKL